MLRCKEKSFLWYLVYVDCLEIAAHPLPTRDRTMSKTASLGFATPSSFFGRLLASIDRLLLAYAEMTIRNGDVSRCEV
jgi:hypothetical protein